MRNPKGPYNWGRVVPFPQFPPMELILIATGAFVDDVFCAESSKSAMSGRRAFKHL